MPKFDDYEKFEDEDAALELPVHGKTYRIAPLGLKSGIWLDRFRSGDTSVADGMTGTDIMRMAIGADTFDQMVADDLPRPTVSRIYVTAMAFHEGGEGMARQVWERSIDPELEAALKAAMQDKTPNRAARRASQRSSSTVAAAGTRSPASSRTTTSPKGTQRAATAKRRGK